MPKITQPTHTALVLNPRINELRISLDLPLHFGFRTQRLGLDTNPAGMPHLALLDSFSLAPDRASVCFTTSGARPRTVTISSDRATTSCSRPWTSSTGTAARCRTRLVTGSRSASSTGSPAK
jgi:hypothetical protein